MIQSDFRRLIDRLETIVPEILFSSDRFKKIEAEILSLYQPVMTENGTSIWKNFESIEVRCPRNRTDLVTLILTSWWMTPEIGIIIRMAVEDELKLRQRSEDLLLLFESKESFFFVLYNDSRFDDRLLGEILSKDQISNVINRLRLKIFYVSRSKPRRLVRHKGYRDKGTLPSISEKAIRELITEDIRSQTWQNKRDDLEKNREFWISVHKSWIQNLEGFLDPLSSNFYLKEDKLNERKQRVTEDRIGPGGDFTSQNSKEQTEVRELGEEIFFARSRNQSTSKQNLQSRRSFEDILDEESESIILLLELPEED